MQDRTLDKQPDAGQVARQTGDRIPDRTLAATDRTQDSSVRSITVRLLSDKSATGHVQWQATRRWPASDQYIAGSTVGTTGRVRSVAVSRDSTPTATFSVGLINTTPNWPFEECGAEETYQGC